MDDQSNGMQQSDVEMKEEGVEVPVQAPPAYQSESQQEPATLNGDVPQSNGIPLVEATPAIPQADAGAIAEPPAVIPPAPAPTPVAVAQPTAHLSAPTPPAASVRESSRPSSIPPAGTAPPEKPSAHGSSARVYLNQNVTPHLLEGMKYLAAYQPEKPLEWLSEFLAKRSGEVEGEA